MIIKNSNCEINITVPVYNHTDYRQQRNLL